MRVEAVKYSNSQISRYYKRVNTGLKVHNYANTCLIVTGSLTFKPSESWVVFNSASRVPNPIKHPYSVTAQSAKKVRSPNAIVQSSAPKFPSIYRTQQRSETVAVERTMRNAVNHIMVRAWPSGLARWRLVGSVSTAMMMYIVSREVLMLFRVKRPQACWPWIQAKAGADAHLQNWTGNFALFSRPPPAWVVFLGTEDSAIIGVEPKPSVRLRF